MKQIRNIPIRDRNAKFNWLTQHVASYLYAYAIVGSLIMTGIIWAWQQPFNSDGIIYLYAAHIYKQHGLHAAMAIYSWPFLSIIIAWLSSITHLPILYAGYLFNLLCDTLSVIIALAIAAAIGYDKRQQVLLLLILLLFPWFNHFRAHILRGHGYYAASLLSMLLLIYHAKQPRLLWALSFSITALLAMLFRIEGVIILLLAPLALLLLKQYSYRQRCWAIFSCYIVPLGLVIVWVLLHKQLYLYNIGQIKTDILKPLYQPLYTFIQESHKIARHILPFNSLYDATWLLAGGIIALLIHQVIATLGIVYFILALYTLYRINRWGKLKPRQQQATPIVATYLILTLLTGLFFLIYSLFLTDRYIALFAIIVVLLLPPGITQLYDYYCDQRSAWRKIIPILLAVALLFNAVASIWYFGPSKYYVVAAGRWIRRNLPVQAKIYMNDPQLAYYAGKLQKAYHIRQQGSLLKTPQADDWHQYDYFAVKFSNKTSTLETQWDRHFPQSIITFGQKRDGIVKIFARAR